MTAGGVPKLSMPPPPALSQGQVLPVGGIKATLMQLAPLAAVTVGAAPPAVSTASYNTIGSQEMPDVPPVPVPVVPLAKVKVVFAVHPVIVN